VVVDHAELLQRVTAGDNVNDVAFEGVFKCRVQEVLRVVRVKCRCKGIADKIVGSRC
jgi:hypothetical protein